MTLTIPKKVRGLVESYVMRKNRNLEKGGYLIGRENMIVAFLPVPNFSTGSHANSYSIAKGTTYAVAQEFASIVSGEIIADVHTHPDGTIPSEQDGRYVRGLNWPFHAILADHGTRFEWYCVDNQFRGVALMESDQEIEGIMELVAGELSLRNLGTIFLTPSGEILSTKKEGLAFVSVDVDAVRVSEWWPKVKAKSDGWRFKQSMAQCVRDTGIPMPRVKEAFRKLGWQGYH